MERTLFEQGGQKIRLNDFQRIENDKYTAIQGLGEVFYKNTILSGCTITVTASGPNFIWTITSGVCYVNGYGVVRFPANTFTSTYSNVSTAYCYIKQEYNSGGTTIFQDNTTHQTWLDVLGYFYTPDQNTTGLVNKGLKSAFNGTLPATYASKTLYDATAATVAAIPSIYQTIAGMSSYTTNAVATATYRRISDSYTKADVNSLLTPLETTSHASVTYQTIAGMSNYYTKTEINSKLPTLIVMGYISSSATVATVRKAGLVSSLGCSKISTGRYTITHNYGSMNYMVFATCVAPSGTGASIKVGSIGKGYNSFEIILGDDTTANDSAFDFIMYAF